ncbi:MAG TPA: hypothetical protein GX507_06160 [Clostridia bacterium]|nr:hypothetical protein [Clostridia bacterium]
MEKLRRLLKIRGLSLLSKDNVVGVGMGYKHVGGVPTDKVSLVVLVKKKVPAPDLNPKQIIPKSVGTVRTDVIEVGEVRLLQRRSRMRPAPGGVSIGHYKVTAGTLGAIVADKKTGQPLILSNNHVLANMSEGNDDRASIGDPILQPGRYDGGTDDDIIGHLERFVGIYRSGEEAKCAVAQGLERLANRIIKTIRPKYSLKIYKTVDVPNLVDAALAKPVSAEVVEKSILEVGPVKGMTEAQVGMKVKKSGRTSGLSFGEIKVVGATMKVAMGDIGYAYFSDQIVTTAMAQPGDSGSLLLDENDRAVGLISAGSEYASMAGTISNVLEMLEATL